MTRKFRFYRRYDPQRSADPARLRDASPCLMTTLGFCFPRQAMHCKEAGFTLIETLVAFAVLALIMTVLFGGLSQMVIGGRHAEILREALQLAQSRLDGLGVVEPLVPGESAGHFGNGFDWHLRVDAPHRSARGVSPVGTWVEITVSATAGATLMAPAVSLVGYKLVEILRP